MLKPNRKTLWSCEPSESCLYRLLGSPCSYCYTLHPWNGASKRSGPPKLFQQFQPGSIALLPKQDQEFLQRTGLRFFSNCDYIASREMVGYIKLACAEAHMLNIPTKAITKNPVGAYGIGFGAVNNFPKNLIIQVSGFDSGVHLGLVHKKKHHDHPLVKAARDLVNSKNWQDTLRKNGLGQVD